MRNNQLWWILGIAILVAILVWIAAYATGMLPSTVASAPTTATSTASTTAPQPESSKSSSHGTGGSSSVIGGITNPGAPTSTAPYQTVLLQIGTTLDSSGVKATPLAVTEDSRCPEGVQCIQAGTVKVSIRISFGAYTTTRTFTLGQPQSMYGYTAELTDVRPTKKEGVTINPNDYRFVFTIAKP